MSLYTDLKERLIALLFRDREDRELAEELRFHLEMEEQANLRRGLSSEEARRRAAITLGGVEQTKEAVRDARGIRLLEDAGRDAAYALRSLARTPGFTVTAVLVLALGIGANTVIFSVISTLVLDAVTLPDAERLMNIDLRTPTIAAGGPVRPADLEAWHAEADAFEALAGYTARGYTLGDPEGRGAARVDGYRVTPDYFQVTGARALLGRTLLPEEAEAGRDAVAVLSERAWRGHFGAAPGIVGRTIRVDGERRTVVGVLPDAHRFPPEADLWVPLVPTAAEREARILGVLGRLHPGASPELARTQLEAVQRRLDETRSEEASALGVRVLGLAENETATPWTMIRIMLAAVAFVLLIACANVAGLLLARATTRRHEIAVRASLGAGRGRIVRQLLTESMVLALAAGALGAALAFQGVALLRDAVPAGFALRVAGWDGFTVDSRALGWTLGLSALTGLAFGLAPALYASRTDLAAVLRDGSRTATGRQAGRSQRVLVGFEVALAVVLLAGAGLLVRSFVELVSTDPGFRAERVLTMELGLPRAAYKAPDEVVRFEERVLDRVRALPGVASAGLVNSLPMSRTGAIMRYALAGGSESGSGAESDSESGSSLGGRADGRAEWRVVSPGYFETLGIPIVRGRGFAAADGEGTEAVAVVSAAFAARHWPESEPIGRRLVIGGRERVTVGVAGDVAHFGAQRGRGAAVYVPRLQHRTRGGFLALRTDGDPAALAAAVRREIAAVDADVAVSRMRGMAGVVADFLAPERLMATMLALFAAIAVAIAGIGLYALIAYGVERRRHEFGIRLALGARAEDIVRLVTRQGLGPVLAGVAIGLLGSLGVNHVLASFLFGVRPGDPAVLAATAALLVATAVAASVVPARRALDVDPASTLRDE